MDYILYRKEKKVIDFEVGDRSYKTTQKLFCRNKYKKFATDKYPVYRQVIPKDKHIVGVSYTQGIENLNG